MCPYHLGDRAQEDIAHSKKRGAPLSILFQPVYYMMGSSITHNKRGDDDDFFAELTKSWSLYAPRQCKNYVNWLTLLFTK